MIETSGSELVGEVLGDRGRCSGREGRVRASTACRSRGRISLSTLVGDRECERERERRPRFELWCRDESPFSASDLRLCLDLRLL
jgi:hypothetical protein